MRTATTQLGGLVVVDTTPFRDSRGEFTRFFCSGDLADFLGSRTIAQINCSKTHSCGAIRGLHFQHAPGAEMKLVRCTRGRVWDVAVDLRVNSPTYLQWHAEELSAANHRMLIIPEGFAHGFQTLETDCELLYLMTAPYRPELADGIRYDDPELAISWPLPVAEISERDLGWPPMPRNALTGARE